MTADAVRPRSPGEDDTSDTMVPEPLVELTDEETVVLFGRDPDLVALPYLDLVPEEEHRLVLQTAYRSLLSRGLIAPVAPGRPPREDGRPEAEASAALAALTQLRTGAPVLLCVSRVEQEECVLRYAHVADEFVVVEDVVEGGLHRFGWVARDRLREALQVFLVPDDAAAGSGAPVTVDVSREGQPDQQEEPLAARPVPSVLESATVTLDVCVRQRLDDGPDTLLGMFLGPGGCWLTRARFGAGGDLTFEPFDPADVGALVDDLVCRAERAVAEAAERHSQPPGAPLPDEEGAEVDPADAGGDDAHREVLHERNLLDDQVGDHEDEGPGDR